MRPSEFVRPLVDGATELLSDEADYWREEVTRPWREGGRGRPARVGRWIGLSLAVGAAAAGIIAALRSERPWD